MKGLVAGKGFQFCRLKEGLPLVLTQIRCGGKGWAMLRQLRVQYPGAICHVMNYGDRRELIYPDEANRLSRNTAHRENQSNLNLCQK